MSDMELRKGRPKKDKTLDHNVGIRLDTKTYSALQVKAIKAKKNISQYIRTLIDSNLQKK